VTVGLMDALAAAGDRAGAIQHARVYELLVEQELDLPPDKDVLAFAERLRTSAAETSSVPTATAATVAAPPVEPSAAPASTAVAAAAAPQEAQSIQPVVVARLGEAPSVAPQATQPEPLASPSRARGARFWAVAASALVIFAAAAVALARSATRKSG